MASGPVSITVGVKRKYGQIDSPEKQFVCDFPGCSKTFGSKPPFTRHLRSHSEQNAPPSSYEGWKQHYKYKHLYGLPDGSVWSCHVGRFLKGRMLDGYSVLQIDGKDVRRHRLNFEIDHGRAILPGMEIDHIIPSETPDDSWANLQELTKPEHHRKTLAENPDFGQKSSVTKGSRIIALHVASGKEVPYASIKVAASALGLPQATVTLRIREGSSKEYGGHVFRRCALHVAEQDDKPGEEWKDAKLYERLIRGIRVSNLGRVQFLRGRRTEGWIQNERHEVGLTVDGRNVRVFVHVLMAHTFLGPPPSVEHTVDHIDRNCVNNIIENLRWAITSEQGRNKVTNRAVCKYDLQWKLLETYSTIAEAAEKSGISWDRVNYAVRTGSTANGFCWMAG